jgi:hypothetical protein
VVLRFVPLIAPRTFDAGSGVLALIAVLNFTSETVAFLVVRGKAALGALDLVLIVFLAGIALVDRASDAGVV